MQEVFEKIVEKLEEIKSITMDLIEYQAVSDIESICNEIEDTIKEYNNGWIPVSERLPETPKGYADYYWCTLKSEKYNETVCKIVRYERFANRNFWQLSWEDRDIKQYKVIAWQSLPELYKSEDE